jgi:hypothetical protein
MSSHHTQAGDGPRQPSLFADPSAEAHAPAHYYRSEAIGPGERADLSAQVQELAELPDLRLAEISRGWVLCRRRDPCFPVSFKGNPGPMAGQVRRLLANCGSNGYGSAVFQRFARLYQAALDNWALFPRGVSEAFWQGQDFARGLDGSQGRLFNVYPQPQYQDLPALAWIATPPLAAQAVVCAAWPICFGGVEGVEAGVLGRVESCGSKAANVAFHGYPHLVLCTWDMLRVPTGPLPRRALPPRTQPVRPS